jgi:hypothetical protein
MGIELGVAVQPACQFPRLDQMKVRRADSGLTSKPRRDSFFTRALRLDYLLHLSHKRRARAEFRRPISDIASRNRKIRPLQRLDKHYDHLWRSAVLDQRKDRRVSRIQSVPVSLTLNLDRMVQRGQAS